MQLRQQHLSNTFTKNIINNTAKFIDRNFDFNMDSKSVSQIKQMPIKQLFIFAKQSFQKQYYINVTMVNEESMQGKLIKRINANKYILEVNKNLFQIIDLKNLKSINLI
ncbi:hypothetical protein [Companilactobacillus baiquanensis]|uniref:YolD-like family protein n=1 Tax=Companilactobacillus baiquanensis TaxID=2486005 RepID=A0ABW1UU41_9LACO|nr:hypothetical protein [Companilactobacillus baiquanensis]